MTDIIGNVAADDIKLSVAIPTFERPLALKECLQSVVAQTVNPYEILVSDDSVNEATIELNQLLCRSVGAIWLQGPRRGLYANRNHLWSHYTGTHVLQCDDDHTHVTAYLESVNRTVCDDPDTVHAFSEHSAEDGLLRPPIQFDECGKIEAAPPIGSASIAEGTTCFPRSVTERYRYTELFRYGPAYLLLAEILRMNQAPIRVHDYSGTTHWSEKWFFSGRNEREDMYEEAESAFAIRLSLTDVRGTTSLCFWFYSLYQLLIALTVGTKRAHGRLRFGWRNLRSIQSKKKILKQYIEASVSKQISQ